MGRLVTVRDPNNPTTPLVYRFNGDGTQTLITAPTELEGTDNRPVFLGYRKRTYILNQMSQNVVINEFGTMGVAGIAAPTVAPTLATSGTGVTGTAICFYTFAHKEGGIIVHESDPSPGATVVLTNQGRAWTNLLATSPSTRVNTIRGYVSMDGADARFAWERPLGTTSVTENVATLALGEVMSTDRGVPPRAYIGEIYHDRAWYIDKDNLNRIYYSKLFEPESVSALNYLNTWDGEFVTGIKKLGDVLLVFCRSCTYTITGWDEEDIIIRKISPSIGCISHWSIVDINGRLWFASQDGVFIYDGSFQHMMKDMDSYWRDEYLDNITLYENAIASDDKYWHTYKLLIPLGGPVRYYIGHYKYVEPQLTGGVDQPDWTFDIRNRNDYTLGTFFAGTSGNAHRDEVYTGSCDGYVRKENIADDPDDDGDTYGKALTIRTRHFLYDDPGGDINEGKKLLRTWSYVESEQTPWTLKLYGGDEWAGEGAVITTKNIAASDIPSSYTATTIRAEDSVNPIQDNSFINTANDYPTTNQFGASMEAGDTITVSGFTQAVNNGSFTVVEAGVGLIQVAGNTLVDEAAGASITITGFPSVTLPKTVHPHTMPERISGRGFTFKYEASSPVQFYWRGFGGTYAPGSATRGLL